VIPTAARTNCASGAARIGARYFEAVGRFIGNARWVKV
jgi:hypothetical protein